MDRRRHIRIEKRLRCAWLPYRPLELQGSGESGPTLRHLSWVRDLSQSGCFIEAPTAHVPLARVRLELRFELPFGGLDPIRAVGEVVRPVDDQGFAVHFLRLSRWSAGWIQFLSRAEVFDHHRRLFL